MRKLVLGIPAQASGKNLTRPLMPSAPQTSCVRATSPHHRKLGAGYVALPQMTGRRFGKPFILSPPTLALRFRQNNGPTPSGDYQPSRSLSMAGSDGSCQRFHSRYSTLHTSEFCFYSFKPPWHTSSLFFPRPCYLFHIKL